MESEVKLSEKQKKNTLSAQKKSRGPRNVLTTSLPEYWPCLKDEQIEKFKEIIKLLSKSDVTLGLQSTLRNLKHAKYLILFDEINPRWFGKHLLSMTLNTHQNIKIFIIPHLKDITKEMYGVASIIFCIKKEIEDLSQFYNTLDVHKELLKSYCPQSSVSPPKSSRKSKKLKPEKITPIIHLKRSNKLAFIPSNLTDKMETEETGDFICLKKYEETSSTARKYQPMRIKHVFPNPNRKNKK